MPLSGYRYYTDMEIWQIREAILSTRAYAAEACCHRYVTNFVPNFGNSNGFWDSPYSEKRLDDLAYYKIQAKVKRLIEGRVNVNIITPLKRDLQVQLDPSWTQESLGA